MTENISYQSRDSCIPMSSFIVTSEILQLQNQRNICAQRSNGSTRFFIFIYEWKFECSDPSTVRPMS